MTANNPDLRKLTALTELTPDWEVQRHDSEWTENQATLPPGVFVVGGTHPEVIGYDAVIQVHIAWDANGHDLTGEFADTLVRLLVGLSQLLTQHHLDEVAADTTQPITAHQLRNIGGWHQ